MTTNMIVLSILLGIAVIAIILLVIVVIAQRWAITDITEEEKRRAELLKAEDVFAWINRAKDYFRQNPRYSMYFCFQATRYLHNKLVLQEHIPEFKPETFGITEWWPAEDVTARLDAFNTLLDIYKNKIKELCDGEEE